MFTPFCSADLSTLTTAAKRDLIAQLKASIKSDIANKIANRESEKLAKATAREAKKAERILKLEAKIEALKNPVGTKAIKANRKGSQVKIFNAEEIAECNAIAARLQAAKA